jgi:hypothetical protein
VIFFTNPPKWDETECGARSSLELLYSDRRRQVKIKKKLNPSVQINGLDRFLSNPTAPNTSAGGAL